MIRILKYELPLPLSGEHHVYGTIRRWLAVDWQEQHKLVVWAEAMIPEHPAELPDDNHLIVLRTGDSLPDFPVEYIGTAQLPIGIAGQLTTLVVHVYRVVP